MKRIITLIIALISILSCGQNADKTETKSTVQSQKTEGTGFQRNDRIDKNENVKIDSTRITCNCPAPYSDASVQLRIDYSTYFIKLCTWFYDDATQNVNEFQIFDNNDNLIFEGFPPSEYLAISIEQPLTIRQVANLPDENRDWSLTPIFDIQIIRKNLKFTTHTKLIFEPPKWNKARQDSIFQIFKSQPQHNGDYDKQDPPFVNESYIGDLFLCALNGNLDCLNAFESLNSRFVTDGASGELYSELLAILRVYKSLE